MNKKPLIEELDINNHTKEIKKKVKWLPVAFRITYYGGWLSPRGILYNNIQSNYDESTLNRGHLNIPVDLRDIWSLIDYAYYNGWISISYYQSYGGTTINFSKFVRRRITITCTKNTLTDPKIYRRLLAVIRFYEEFFRKKLEYDIVNIEFLNVEPNKDNLEKIPVASYIDNIERIYSSRNVDLYLQRLSRQSGRDIKNYV